MRTDRQSDVTNLIVAFRNFPKAPKNGDGTCGVLHLHFSTRGRAMSVTGFC